MTGLNQVNHISQCHSFILRYFSVSASLGFCRWGEDRICQQTLKAGQERRKKEKGNEGGQRPQSQIKALSLLAASAFQTPARIESRLTLQLSLSVIVQKEGAQAGERQTVRDEQTDGAGENRTIPQTKWSQAFRPGQEIKKSSRFNQMKETCVLPHCVFFKQYQCNMHFYQNVETF